VSDQAIDTGAAPAEGTSPDDGGLAKIKADYENQLRGLNRANSLLKKELDEKSASGKSVEDRIATLEKERQVAQRRADTMEAFGKHGISEDFRALFDLEDPLDRAKTLKSLLEDYTRDVQKKAAAEFLRDPEAPRDGGSNQQYTVEQMKGRSPEEINRLWSAGKIKGSPLPKR
jgi:hypothetical protein